MRPACGLQSARRSLRCELHLMAPKLHKRSLPAAHDTQWLCVTSVGPDVSTRCCWVRVQSLHRQLRLHCDRWMTVARAGHAHLSAAGSWTLLLGGEAAGLIIQGFGICALPWWRQEHCRQGFAQTLQPQAQRHSEGKGGWQRTCRGS